MTYAEQIAATVAAIRADVEELRDEYEHAFAEWARAVGDVKRWIAAEAKNIGCPTNMVLAFGYRNHWRYRQLEKTSNNMHALMADARARCVAAGDEDWAEAQESREYDVENA